MPGKIRGILETVAMTTAVVIATAISASPVAARLIETAVGAPVQASVDRTRLPVGDGKVVRQPTVGGLWSCEQRFTGSGAFREGPWFRGDGAYDATAKAIVDGDVQWPHQFSIDVSGGTRTFTGNNLPNHGTGVYPVSPTDDAYLYDRNPNSIDARTVQFSTPAIPTPLAQPTCAPGAVGILLTGSYLFNAVDAGGRDAVAHEAQDQCQGHPAPGSVYHYHSLSSCIDGGDPNSHSPLMGYAFDGFGIYGFRGDDGAELSNEDLDACHGHTHTVEWDGQPLEMFHYHATQEFPYTVGCFRGRAAQVRPGADSNGNPPTGPGAPGADPNGGNGPTNGNGPAVGPPPGQGGGPGAGGPPPGPPPGQGQRLQPPPPGAQGR